MSELLVRMAHGAQNGAPAALTNCREISVPYGYDQTRSRLRRRTISFPPRCTTPLDEHRRFMLRKNPTSSGPCWASNLAPVRSRLRPHRNGIVRTRLNLLVMPGRRQARPPSRRIKRTRRRRHRPGTSGAGIPRPTSASVLDGRQNKARPGGQLITLPPNFSIAIFACFDRAAAGQIRKRRRSYRSARRS